MTATVDNDAPRGRILAEDIIAVRERAHIEDIVGQYVTLKASGPGSQKGLCPFHDEKSPSFHVRPQLGLWHCFGCSEGGDVISFVQKIDSLAFAEAVEHLANKIGIQLRYEEGAAGGGVRRGEDPKRRARLIDAHRVAENYYRSQLMTPEAATARRFLAAKGFGRESADQFGVGYAPQGWDHLLRHLRGKGFTDAELAQTGLLSEGARGSYDRFRGRLMWPIRDVTGATIGFGARKLYDDDPGPKYLNTPETTLYHKAQVLYGIDLAKKHIAKSKRIVVVEGYTDVMAAHLAGELTAVATCGTAFGPDHARIARRMLGDTANVATLTTSAAGEVIFTFDGDSAGQKAALRAFGEDQRFSAQTYVAVAEDGLDPCDLRVTQGGQAVLDLINNRRPLFEFVIQKVLDAHDLTTAEGRVAALRSAAPVVASIRDAALRPEYSRLLASWTGLDVESVRGAVASAEANPRVESLGLDRARRQSVPAPEQDERQFPVPDRHDATVRVERAVLGVVLQRPLLACDAGFDSLVEGAFTTLAFRPIHEALLRVGGTRAAVPSIASPEERDYQNAASAWIERILDAVPGELRPLVTELAVTALPEDRDDALDQYVTGLLSALEDARLSRMIADVKARLQQLDPSDPAYREVFTLLIKLEDDRRALFPQS